MPNQTDPIKNLERLQLLATNVYIYIYIYKENGEWK